MRNALQLLFASMVTVAQVASPVPNTATDPTAASANDGRTESRIVFTTAQPQPVQLEVKRADFEAEVLSPLREAQAKQAAIAAEKARQERLARQRAAVKTVSAKSNYVRVNAPATPENMLKLRFCESGNRYDRNSGNGYYGAYQFDIRTWNNYGGYARADLAPAAVQDAKFMDTFNRRGWQPWPACSRKLGLY